MSRLIKLDNSIDKLRGFIPSVDTKYLDRNRIKRPDGYIPTIDVIEEMQDKGFQLTSGKEIRNGMGKPNSHILNFDNLDLNFGKKGDGSTNSRVILTNSCDGVNPLELSQLAYRQICSNGMYGWEREMNEQIQHLLGEEVKIPQVIGSFEDRFKTLQKYFEQFNFVELTPQQQQELAYKAINLRRDINGNVDPIQLLNACREGDKGDQLWKVYNRIQENLTQDNRLKDKRGKYLFGVGPIEDKKITNKLTSLASSFVC